MTEIDDKRRKELRAQYSEESDDTAVPADVRWSTHCHNVNELLDALAVKEVLLQGCRRANRANSKLMVRRTKHHEHYLDAVRKERQTWKDQCMQAREQRDHNLATVKEQAAEIESLLDEQARLTTEVLRLNREIIYIGQCDD